MRVDPAAAQISLYTYGKISEHQPGANYVIDVFGLRDPMSNRGFNKTFKDGRPKVVQDYVKEDSRVPAILDQVKLLAHLHITAGTEKWISLAFRDHHGLWIAPAIGEIAADMLDNLGYRVSLYHFETFGPVEKGA